MAAMMPAPPFDEFYAAGMNDDAHSLQASIEDFEEQERRSPIFPDLRSDRGESDIDDRSSEGMPWSPPGFKNRNANASGWFRQDPYRNYDLKPSISPSRSRQTSPEIYQDATDGDGDPDITIAVNTPLPAGADSPRRGQSPEIEAQRNSRNGSPEQEDVRPPESPNNYVRLQFRAEVQHREPFVPILNYIQRKFDAMTKNASTTLLSVVTTIIFASLLRIILVPPVPPPVPDLVKVSTLAKSFEPLIYYSENGYSQITALQETSVAVWDLGESVRSANMTSAPIIVRSLDELSESLKTLGLELTRFFSDVDSDVDSILIVMDWAKRELEGVTSGQGAPITGVIFDHLHGVFNRGGLLETSKGPTALGKILTDIFGSSSPQRTRATLTRTFHEFVNVLEESINSELTHSAALFALFESIDRQFLNLQRTVVRETDTQERLESDLLSSLWTRVIGPNAAMLRKFEKNKQLLSSVRARTVNNKHMIMEHHGRLQTLKVNLETLRRKLVSPLVRRNDSVSIDNASVLDQQIRGLEGTYDYLRGVREKQKSKLMEMVYGAKAGRPRLVGVSGGLEGIGLER
ncbi:hypothetical protein LTR99_003761 [Exophiala xenobiotica]|uniref:Uncharacterized protein n=1 Tax=Vermiconidia calcicola TaxID=1690605 RepID=A0AAV9PY50_9PEZI|nr:hypothetical protein LTR99_003761 [Exophiala xenobiotica]KAK5435229.1 hypothetical protein LTR34_002732 [Exophiala xenobiotica]KAK5531454.1 hypothetical protein LTR25_008563 [Vermiconidia calcicola]KAK5554200.1 hypothetical protein LTR46_007849 [Exophiala xenobiotica]